jgi:glycosyltransferase involved in cell wall biosynthesis
VRDGITGRLVSSRRPEEFAAVIEWVLEHCDESAAMAACAAEIVRTEQTVERMVDGYRRLYAELLANAGKKGR